MTSLIRVSQICKLYAHIEENGLKEKRIAPPLEKISKPSLKRFVQNCQTELDQTNLSLVTNIWKVDETRAMPESVISQLLTLVACNQLIALVIDKHISASEFYHQNVFSKEENLLISNFNVMVDGLTNQQIKGGPTHKAPDYFQLIFDIKIPVSTSTTTDPSTFMTRGRGESLNRGRSDSLKRNRLEKQGEEERLRKQAEEEEKKRKEAEEKKDTGLAGITPDMYAETMKALSCIQRMEDKIDDLTKLKTTVTANTSSIQKNTGNIYSNSTRLTNQENRIKALEGNKATAGTAPANHDFVEYFSHLERVAAARSAVARYAKDLDFLIPVEMIKDFETNSKIVALNDAANSFEISDKKILKFLNAKFRMRVDWLRILGKRWVNLKLGVTIQFQNPFLAKNAIDKRLELKILDDSKKNCSLSRVIHGCQQKTHNLLSEMKRNGKIKELFISKSGFVNYKIDNPTDPAKDLVRTVLDHNEILYLYNRNEPVDPDTLDFLNNFFFVNSGLVLTAVPKRFKPKDPDHMSI